jgi:hypothetical protein
MNTRKTISVSPEVHARFMKEAERLKVNPPKLLADRIITRSLKDKTFVAALKEHFAK